MKKSLIIGMAAGIALSCFVGCNHNLITNEESYVIERNSEFIESENTENESTENNSARYGKGHGYGNGNGRNGGGGTTNTSSFS